MNIRTVPAEQPSPVDAVVAVSDALLELGAAIDAAGTFPLAALDLLHRAGLMTAPFEPVLGGCGWACPGSADSLFRALRLIGSGDLSVGRLYEGHVNAVALVQRFGRPDQVAALADAVAGGAMSAVWNAEASEPVRFVREGAGWLVEGRKILSSGAGSITRPLVTGLVGDEVMMAVLPLDGDHAADMSRWMPSGMRSSATGTIDLTGVRLAADAVIGTAGDYKRQPTFSGGAWRFCAVQLGAIDRLVDLFRTGLNQRGRDRDPYQKARVAACVASAETAALWIAKAARLTDEDVLPADDVVAYAGLTRMVTERAGLDVIEQVHRGIGLTSYLRPDPIERIARDLATYLRQPAPDGAMADAAAAVLSSAAPLRQLWGGR